jgi:hypothetical protein
MMTITPLGPGWLVARCPKHPIDDYTGRDSASRTLVDKARHHNAKLHPRRFRRLVRGFIS